MSSHFISISFLISDTISSMLGLVTTPIDVLLVLPVSYGTKKTRKTRRKREHLSLQQLFL